VSSIWRWASDARIARLELDRLVGLPDGYSGKLLSKNPRKNIGIATLGPLLESLGLVICVLENPSARDRTLASRTPFDASNRRLENHSNPRKKATATDGAPAQVGNTPPAKVEALKPRSNEPTSRSHLHVVEQRVKGVGRWGGRL